MDTPFGVWLPQVTILHCQRLEQVQTVIDALRERHCVVLQLEAAEPAEAQRILDFVAGASSALDAELKPIGDATFVCAPLGVLLSEG
jgi:cell division inhibitor SepF